MNQEWYCTGKVIAQITICIYHFNLRRAQGTNLEFHQRGSDATVVYNNMPASALDKIVTFAVEVLCERKPRLQLRRRRLLANELTCAYQVTRNTTCTRCQSGKHISYFQLSYPRKPTMINGLIKFFFFEKKNKKESTTILYHIKMQKFILNKTATWSDMKSQRSRIVFNAKYA